jgi:hypothetical protein
VRVKPVYIDMRQVPGQGTGASNAMLVPIVSQVSSSTNGIGDRDDRSGRAGGPCAPTILAISAISSLTGPKPSLPKRLILAYRRLLRDNHARRPIAI